MCVVDIVGNSRAAMSTMVAVRYSQALVVPSNYCSEICYNVRYIDRNGRKDEDPWSLRQIGVYERYNVEKQSSVWFLLQPSAHVCQRLKDCLQMKPSSTSALTDQTLLLHALIQFTASRHWMDYVDDLRLQIEKLVRGSLR